VSPLGMPVYTCSLATFAFTSAISWSVGSCCTGCCSCGWIGSYLTGCPWVSC